MMKLQKRVGCGSDCFPVSIAPISLRQPAPEDRSSERPGCLAVPPVDRATPVPLTRGPVCLQFRWIWERKRKQGRPCVVGCCAKVGPLCRPCSCRSEKTTNRIPRTGK
ncbi:hypothetical protein CHARACLAT_004697 [Characodon lateralis]|uniref:Hepcidin n=1 Tax=Characodon lateralis TaxID=208331 RepID=A0ABU7DZ91_9TELE|nr:hypothetical protein [Characodon lateralis]